VIVNEPEPMRIKLKIRANITTEITERTEELLANKYFVHGAEDYTSLCTLWCKIVFVSLMRMGRVRSLSR